MKKFIFITTLSTALLLAACSGSSNKETINNNESESDSTNEEISKVEEDNFEIDEVDEEAAVEASDNFQIGDSAEIDGITITIDNAYLTDERNDSSIIKVSGVLVLDVTYENNTAETFPAGRDIIVEVGGELAHSYELEGALLEDVAPGDSISGKMAYGLISAPEHVVAIFEPLMNTSGEQAIFDIEME